MRKICTVFLLLLLLSSSLCSERTEPIALYLLVDKSISMEESGSFKEVKNWLTDSFIQNNVIKGDTVVLYFFYGETVKTFNKTLATNDEFIELKNAVAASTADGAYTDIGLAVDTVKQAVTSGAPGKHKVVLVLTDLIQEASYGSKYAGTYYDFAQRYMTEDRIISHSDTNSSAKWYEITVQTSNLNTVEEKAEKIYNTIKNSTQEPLYAAQNRGL